MFADELNKSKVVQDYIGPINKKDIHLLHSVVHFTWLHVLYSSFPTVLNFGKYFYIFTKHQYLLDMYKIENYQKLERERKAKYAKRPRNSKKEKWAKHLNG